MTDCKGIACGTTICSCDSTKQGIPKEIIVYQNLETPVKLKLSPVCKDCGSKNIDYEVYRA